MTDDEAVAEHTRELDRCVLQQGLPTALRDAMGDAVVGGARIQRRGWVPTRANNAMRYLMLVVPRGSDAEATVAGAGAERCHYSGYYDPARPSVEWVGYRLRW
jgi:hypothetical protein